MLVARDLIVSLRDNLFLRVLVVVAKVALAGTVGSFVVSTYN